MFDDGPLIGAAWVAPGDASERPVSMFEFWPSAIMYAPVALQWLLLAARHRSLTVPFVANPGLTLSGMVGVGKSELMQQATGACREAILPWVRHVVGDESAQAQARQCTALAAAAGIGFPLVCKPDIGCRGAGVKLIDSVQQLQAAIAAYPVGAALLCQKLASFEPEAGVFFVKHPGAEGSIASLTFKFRPQVIGDGRSTLEQLLRRDPRAARVQHLYRQRHAARWNEVIPSGEPVRLVFSASHCRGAVFRDAREHITPALTAAINRIMAGIPDFHYGRLDLKFADLGALRAGEGLQVVEINGASAESIQIWDRNASLRDAIGTLLWQYRTLFTLGAFQRQRGHRPPGLLTLLRHWQLERRLTRHYPTTD